MENRLLMIICFIFHCLFYTSCNAQTVVNDEMRKNIDVMVDGYCNQYCNYPESLDGLIAYVEENEPSWSQTEIAKETESAIGFFKKNKSGISLTYSHPTVTRMDLLIMYQDDTLYHKQGEWNFPYIDDVIRSYSRACLKLPESLEDLVRYDSIMSFAAEYVPECWTVTKNYLIENRSKISWSCEGDTLLITASGDTIAYHVESYSQFCCNSCVAYETFGFHFFDANDKVVISSELEKEIKQELNLLRQKNSTGTANKSEVHILQFSMSDGLSAYCKGDTITLESEWYKEVANVSRDFAKEHGLGKIIFPVPDCR